MEKTGFHDINDMEFEFENSTVRIIILQELPQIEVLGKKLGPFKNGDETDVPRWIAAEMVNGGVAKYREKEGLTLQELSKVHWKEALPSSRQIPQLDHNFYCNLKYLISSLKEEGKKDIEKLKEYEKALSISNDIINCRLRKLVTYAASAYQSSDLFKNLTPEEKALLDDLSNLITIWREKILKVEKNG
ncbi:hypothetical protein [[Eubacterium] cellulosolvens]